MEHTSPPTTEEIPTVPAAMANTLSALIESIAGIERMQASLAAAKAELVEQARQWSIVTETSTGQQGSGGWTPRVIAYRVLVSELACALRIPERTADALVSDCETLVSRLPRTLAALGEGAISWRHAQVIIEQARSVPDDAQSDFEATVLPAAKTLTVAKLEHKARLERERRHPESVTDRHRESIEKRRVDCEPARDGMAYLSAYLPAADALGIYNRLTDMAMSQHGPDESRTLAQRRADLFAELLLDGRLRGNARLNGVRPRVLVTVPVLTLLGVSEEPASLEGYGPIDIDTARKLARLAPSFTRILTHPETGVVLSVGRDRYKVPADMRIWLRVRDGTCRFPGCRRAARRCDLDHTIDRQYEGHTSHDNLAHLCPGHHHLKHQTGWTVRQRAAGVIEWRAPSGRVYTTEPETRMDAAPTKRVG